MSTDRYVCLECNEEFSIESKTCPKCGSNKISKQVTVSGKIKTRNGLKLTVKDKSGKIKRKSVSREKVSNHGKEAKETYTVNKTEKRWFHEVKEQDEDGNWKVVHHEDKPLKDKKARKKAQHT